MCLLSCGESNKKKSSEVLVNQPEAHSGSIQVQDPVTPEINKKINIPITISNAEKD